MVSYLAKVKIFIFRPKTMDYSQAFLPKSSSFFEAFLLLAGRCYGAEICVILLLSKFSVSGRKPWTIVQGFDRILMSLEKGIQCL